MNMFSQLGDNDGQPKGNKGKKSNGSGAGKKKKAVQAGAGGSHPTSAVDYIVSEAGKKGFKAPTVMKAIDKMFESGEDYDNLDAVLAKLGYVAQQPKQQQQQKKKKGAAAAPAPKKGGKQANGSKKKGNQQQQQQQKKKATAAAPAPAPAAAPAAPVEEEEEEYDEAQAAADLAAQSDALNHAASLPNLGPVLKGLHQWCQQASDPSELSIFFTGGALETLLANIMRQHAPASVDPAIKELFADLLGNSGRQAVSTFTATLRSMLDTLATIPVAETDSEAYRKSHAAAISCLASSLASHASQVFFSGLAEARATAAVAARQPEVKAIERGLHQLRAAGKLDTRSLFQKRDMLLNLAKTQRSNLAALSQLSQAKQAGGEEVKDEATDVDAVLDALAPPEAAGATKRQQSVRATLAAMKEKYDADCVPFEAKEQELQTEVDALAAQKEALMAQVHALNTEMAAKRKVIKECEAQREALATEVHKKALSLTKEDKDLVAQVQRGQAASVLKQLCNDLDSTLNTVLTKAAAARAKAVSSNFNQLRSSFLVAARGYFATESDCVAFLRQRVAEGSKKLDTMQRELATYTQANPPMTRMVEKVTPLVARVQGEVQQDAAALEVFAAADKALREAVASIAEQAAAPAVGSALSQVDEGMVLAISSLAEAVEKGEAASEEVGAGAGAGAGAGDAGAAGAQEQKTEAVQAEKKAAAPAQAKPKARAAPVASKKPVPSQVMLKPKKGGNPWGAAAASAAPSMKEIIQEERQHPSPTAAAAPTAGAGAGSGAATADPSDELEDGEIAE